MKSCFIIFKGWSQIFDMVFGEKIVNEGLSELFNLLGITGVEVGPDFHPIKKFANCASF